jgi:4-hydroxybenzoate polyprenyltransferase
MKLLRVKHYVKNGLIFLPIVFSQKLTEWDAMLTVGLGFIAFCLISSVIYIFNDIKDIEKDKLHSTKCNRPLASGAVKVRTAVILASLFFVIASCIMIYVQSVLGTIVLAIYLLINIAYSFGLKNIPIVELVFIAAGFILRVLFGGIIIKTNISAWLLYTVISAAFFMALGKRRNELIREGDQTRKVSEKYSLNFLDKMMYVFLTLTVAFYALWCINIDATNSFVNNGIIWSVPIVMIVVIRYCYLIEQNLKSDGDPTNVLLTDKFLLGLVALFMVFILSVIYLPFDNILDWIKNL